MSRKGRRKRGNSPEVIRAALVLKNMKSPVCEHCGSTQNVHLHHIDGNWRNNDITNFQFLCLPHHLQIHGGNFKNPPMFNINLGNNMSAMSKKSHSNIPKTVKDWSIIRPKKNTYDGAMEAMFSQEDFSNSFTAMKVFIGGTGSGKTHFFMNTLIPIRFAMGNQVVFYTFPLNEIEDVNECRDAAVRAGVKYVSVKGWADLNKVYEYVELGERVFVSMHNSYMIGAREDDASQPNIILDNITQFLSTNNKTFSLLIDEVHTWCSTDPTVYELCKGFPPIKFDGAFMRIIKQLFMDRGAHVFGATATPDREITRIVTGERGVYFEIVNERPEYNYFTTAGSATPVFFPWDMNIDSSSWEDKEHWLSVHLPVILDNYRNYIRDILLNQKKYGSMGKTCGMTQLGRSNDKFGLSLGQRMGLFINVIKEEMETLGLPFQDKTCAVMTSDYKEYVSLQGDSTTEWAMNVRGPSLEDSDILEWLNHPTHPLTFLFVIEKGKMGINVGRMKGFFSARSFESKHGSIRDVYDHGEITEMLEQGAGRTCRLHSGQYSKFSEYGDYSLKSTIKNCTEEEMNMWMDLNTSHIYLPDVPACRSAMENFQVLHSRPISEYETQWKYLRMNHLLVA